MYIETLGTSDCAESDVLIMINCLHLESRVNQLFSAWDDVSSSLMDIMTSVSMRGH